MSRPSPQRVSPIWTATLACAVCAALAFWVGRSSVSTPQLDAGPTFDDVTFEDPHLASRAVVEPVARGSAAEVRTDAGGPSTTLADNTATRRESVIRAENVHRALTTYVSAHSSRPSFATMSADARAIAFLQYFDGLASVAGQLSVGEQDAMRERFGSTLCDASADPTVVHSLLMVGMRLPELASDDGLRCVFDSIESETDTRLPLALDAWFGADLPREDASIERIRGLTTEPSLLARLDGDSERLHEP